MTHLATTAGLWPLPDWSKTTLIERKGKQRDDLISGDEGSNVTEVYDDARTEVIGLQREHGLDRIVEGQLRWDDMLCHPLVVLDTVDTGGLVRYYDNNNFYRETIVRGPLEPSGDVAAELTAAAAEVQSTPLQAVLPGPYSLSELATDEHFGSPASFLTAISDLLAGEIEPFPDVTTLFLLEPSLSVAPPDDVQPTVDALQTVVAAATAAGIEDIMVHTYWGVPPEHVYERLRSIEGLGLGFDLVQAPDAALDRVTHYGAPATVALGVVDGQNTRIESAAEIDDVVSRFHEAAAGIDRTYLTPNTELFYLPTARITDKLDAIARAARDSEEHT